MQLANKVAVITGGGNGIGESVAKSLALQKMKIVLADVNQAELNRVVKEIKDLGGETLGILCDVSKEDQVIALMDKAVENFGSINFVFANAGIIKDSLMINTDKTTGKVKSVMSLDDFQRVINVNLTGAFLTAREGAKKMVDGGFEGVIVFTSSINKVGQVGQLNYSSTKASVALWPKILSAEFHMKGIKNIRTAAIAPGYTATPLLKGMNQDALKAMLQDVHIDRMIEPEEIAQTIRFILENDGIDGTCIEITGGLTHGPRALVK